MTPDQRLLLLADRLELNAANPKGMKFDLKCWLEAKGTPTQDCGTTGCAVGLAMLQPEFIAEGLGGLRLGYPTYGGHLISWNSVMEFFGVSYSEVTALFTEEAYINEGPIKGAEAELWVAARIRAFVDLRQALLAAICDELQTV